MTDTFPPEVIAVVARVVRLTRLRKHERMDIERELLSHFREALASGRSASAAIAAFGDPKAAAASLRASAIAKRSAFDRALGTTLRLVGIVTVTVLVGYASFAAYLLMAGAPLRKDMVAVFQSRLAKSDSPSDVAWPIYREALLKLEQGIDARGDRRSDGLRAIDEMPLPGDAQWSIAADWLRSHDQDIQLLHEVRAKPVFGFPVGQSRDAADVPLFGPIADSKTEEERALKDCFPMLGVLLPQLSPMRSAGRILACDAALAAESGDGDRFVADMQTMIAISVHAQDGRLLIGDLVGMAVRAMACKYALTLLEWKPELLNAQQLAAVQQAFESVPQQMRQFDRGAEQLLWEEFAQNFFTDSGDGNGWFRMGPNTLRLFAQVESISGGSESGNRKLSGGSAVALIPVVAAPIAAWTVADRKATLEFVDGHMASVESASRNPIRDRARLAEIDAELESELSRAPLRWMLARLLLPSLTRAALAYSKDRAWCDAVAVTCAALRYQRDRGGWPTQASDLVPDYLTSVPLDPWDGAPIRMATDANGLRIWSVGEDGVDNQGDPFASDNLERLLGHQASPTTMLETYPHNMSDLPIERAQVDWVWFVPSGSFKRWQPPSSARKAMPSGS